MKVRGWLWHSQAKDCLSPSGCCSILSTVVCVCVYALYDFHAWLTHLISLRLCLSVAPSMSLDRPAMQQVLDNLGEPPTSTGAKDIDLLFLRGIMESPTVRTLAEVAHTHGSGWAAVNTAASSETSAPCSQHRSALLWLRGWGALRLWLTERT